MHRSERRQLVVAIAGAALIVAASTAAQAAPLILNGSFETGFSSWTRLNQPGSDGTFALQTGTASPVTGVPVPAPTGGIVAAMTDAEGPGSHVLYQDFLVPVGTTSGTLSFDVFVGNRAGTFF